MDTHPFLASSAPVLVSSTRTAESFHSISSLDRSWLGFGNLGAGFLGRLQGYLYN
jgi:hypothetical protein